MNEFSHGKFARIESHNGNRIRIRTKRIRIDFFVFSKIRIRRIEYSYTPDQRSKIKQKIPWLRDVCSERSASNLLGLEIFSCKRNNCEARLLHLQKFGAAFRFWSARWRNNFDVNSINFGVWIIHAIWSARWRGSPRSRCGVLTSAVGNTKIAVLYSLEIFMRVLYCEFMSATNSDFWCLKNGRTWIFSP
jgi:hypothetical protein